MRKNITFYILLTALVCVVACNNGSQNSLSPNCCEDDGTLLLHIEWPESETVGSSGQSAVIDCGAMNVDTIRAEVLSESNDLLIEGGPWNCSDGEGTIDKVPTGDNHIVILHAYDGDANEVYRGETANVSVQDKETVRVDVTMSRIISRPVALVEDVNPGTGSSFPYRFFEMQNRLYFIAYDTVAGFELHTADSTADGAQLLKDIYPIDDEQDRAGLVAPSDFVGLDGWLYFRANNASGYRLWRSDGTDPNTGSADTSGASYSNPKELTILNDQIFFSAYSDTTGRELWVYETATNKARLAMDINPDGESSNPCELIAIGDSLFFVADDGQHGSELWRADDTASSIAMVKDLQEGTEGGSPRNLIEVNGRLFFTAKDGSQNPGGTPPTHGAEIWMVYETATTIEVQLTGDINATDKYQGSCKALNLKWIYGTTLAFSAYEENTGQELYLYDWNSDSAPRRITDLNPNEGSSHPSNFVYMNDTLYFTAHNNNRIGHLWAYPIAQSPVQCLTGDLHYPSPRDLTVFNETLYFTASSKGSSRKLWAYDGTRTGLVVGANGGNSQHTPTNLFAGKDRLYFSAFDADFGAELFQLTDQ